MSLPFQDFVPGIPAANNNPSADQPRMLTNFTSMNTWMSQDHIGLNTSGGGWHAKLDFLNPLSVPGLTGFGMNVTQIYPSSFTAGTTSYLETYMSASNASGLSQMNGYLPFVKCIVHFTTIGTNNTINPDPGYLSANVGSIKQQGATSNQIVLTFATPLFYAAGPPSPYYIFNSYDSNLGAGGGITMTVTNTSITWTSGRIIPAGEIVSLMVI